MMMIGRGVRRIRQGVVGWQRAFSIQGQASVEAGGRESESGTGWRP